MYKWMESIALCNLHQINMWYVNFKQEFLQIVQFMLEEQDWHMSIYNYFLQYLINKLDF
jgi:hypothetical protein